jgi:L-ribulokinase
MAEASFLICLDYGSESAHGVLVNAVTAERVAEAVHPYRHGIMTSDLQNGLSLPPAWALQDAADYLEAAEAMLALGRGRRIFGIGVGFTANSPMPATRDGSPLFAAHPREPHAYVKLWKHRGAALGRPHQCPRRHLSQEFRRQSIQRMAAPQGRATSGGSSRPVGACLALH